MAYNKTIYVNDSTPAISAENLNKSENELEFLDNLANNSKDNLKTLGIYSPNMVDLTKIVSGRINTDGSILSGASFRTSDYIPVNNNDVVRIVSTTSNGYGNQCAIAFYDSSKVYISNSRSGFGQWWTGSEISFTAPVSAAYCRVSIYTSTGWETTWQVTVNNAIPDTFMPFGLYTPFVTKGMIDDINEDISAISGVYDFVRITGSGFLSGKYIKSSLQVGDTIDFDSNTYRKIYKAKIKGGETYWIVNCAGSTTNAWQWAVTDKNDKILKLPNDVLTVDRGMAKVEAPIEATTLYWTIAQTVSVLLRENKRLVLSEGNKTYPVITTSNATINGSSDVIKNSTAKSVLFESSGYIEYPITSDRYISAGVYIKCDYNSALKVSGINVSIMADSTERATLSIPKDRLKTEQWIFAKLGHIDNTINKVRVSPVFETGQTSATLIISPFVLTDSISRPIAIINFDNAWQASEDCGAYDLLINNNIPFSITGQLESVDSSTKAKLLLAKERGLLDVGTYGNEHYEDTYYPITSSTDMTQANANMLNLLSIKHADGINPVSFGPANHIITQNIINTIKNSGYKIVRVYGTCAGTNSDFISKDIISITETHMSQTLSNLVMMGLGNVYGMFTHGISSDPSSETNPSLYTSYASFSTTINALISLRDMGMIEIMNLKQFVEFVNKDN